MLQQRELIRPVLKLGRKALCAFDQPVWNPTRERSITAGGVDRQTPVLEHAPGGVDDRLPQRCTILNGIEQVEQISTAVHHVRKASMHALLAESTAQRWMLGAAVQLFAAHRDDDEEAASRVRAHVLFPLEPGEGGQEEVQQLRPAGRRLAGYFRAEDLLKLVDHQKQIGSSRPQPFGGGTVPLIELSRHKIE